MATRVAIGIILVADALFAAVLLASCAGSGGSAPGRPEASGVRLADGQLSGATSVAPTKAPGSREESQGIDNVAALPASGRSVAEIKASAPASHLLDNVHLNGGLTCEGCHGQLPAAGTPQAPDNVRCLSCHGGSYETLATKTAPLAARNPHYSHQGPLDCSQCHRVHEPFNYYCNTCHSFSIPERFRGGNNHA